MSGGRLHIARDRPCRERATRRPCEQRRETWPGTHLPRHVDRGGHFGRHQGPSARASPRAPQRQAPQPHLVATRPFNQLLVRKAGGRPFAEKSPNQVRDRSSSQTPHRHDPRARWLRSSEYTCPRRPMFFQKSGFFFQDGGFWKKSAPNGKRRVVSTSPPTPPTAPTACRPSPAPFPALLDGRWFERSNAPSRL